MIKDSYKNWRHRMIHDEYERIQHNLHDTALFGEPVDISHTEELVVAAYHAGRQESQGVVPWKGINESS